MERERQRQRETERQRERKASSGEQQGMSVEGKIEILKLDTRFKEEPSLNDLYLFL